MTERTVGRWERIGSACLALGALALLAVSAWLEPANAGHGTHTQLGLPGCTFLQLTGLPCAMCGATTTFALMAELRWAEGVANQPFAALLFVLTLAVASVSAAEALLPAGRWTRLAAAVEPFEGRAAIGFLAAMMLGWTYKIATF